MNPTPARRRLVVVRHAKSAWPPGVPDRDRPLAPRGRQDAPRVGRWLGAAAGRVDVVVVSPATRAAQTWDLLDPEVDHAGVVRVDPRVYQAWGAHLLDVVRELPAEAHTALVVGHEPGVSELTLTLASHHNQALRRRISHKYPTCAVAILESTRAWSAFDAACADLMDFLTPKDF